MHGTDKSRNLTGPFELYYDRQQVCSPSLEFIEIYFLGPDDAVQVENILGPGLVYAQKYLSGNLKHLDPSTL